MRRVILVLLSIPSLIVIAAISNLSSPKDANVSLAMARAFRTTGLPRLSIPFYTYIMYRAPQFAIVPRSRGLAYDAMGQYDAAIADFTLSEKLESEVADTNYLRALSYAKIGKNEEALKDFDIVVKKAPQEPYYRYYRAKHLIQSGKFWPAITDLNTILGKRNPNWMGFALKLRSDAYLKLGNTQKMWADTIAAKQLKCKGLLRHRCLIATRLRFERLQLSMARLEQSMASIKESSAKLEQSMAKLRSQQKSSNR